MMEWKELSRMRICSIAMVCLLFSSCAKKHTPHNNFDSLEVSKGLAILSFIEQQETMLVDIPIPLYDERIIPSFVDASETDLMVFGYKSPLSRQDNVAFFVNQMERYGWRQIVCFETFESLLEFEVPGRYCTISMRDLDNSGSLIYIFIKKSEPTQVRSESVGVE